MEGYSIFHCGMDRLAGALMNLGVGNPVIDKTGLTGAYDFRLIFTPERRSRGAAERELGRGTMI